MEMVATCAFGIEAVLRREMMANGFDITQKMDGRIYFTGELETVLRANMALRTADRIHVVMARNNVKTFDELFDFIKQIQWHRYVDAKGQYHVQAKSVASTLFSVRDIQAVAKKAVIESLSGHWPGTMFPETGSRYSIFVSLRSDVCEVWLDTSGDALHKRGYRQHQGEAPLKETLAAALVLLSFYEKGRALYDPFCGSGTIPIEAALRAANIAPNLDRTFALQSFPWYKEEVYEVVRRDLMRNIRFEGIEPIIASDIDRTVLGYAQTNAEHAGVADLIRFEVKSFEKQHFEHSHGIIVTNPPYGLRLETAQEAEVIYRGIADMYRRHADYSLYILTAYPGIEKIMGKTANRTRVLFNGNIKSRYYQYYGPRPR